MFSDGWNTHFTAPHPVHGRFVTREIWHAHCVATKHVPPFAIGYTETTDLILLGFVAQLPPPTLVRKPYLAVKRPPANLRA